MNAGKTPHLTGDSAAATTEQALRDRGSLALIAIERTRMPMVVTDPRLPDNPIVLANDAFLAVSGYSADEIIGQNCRLLQGEQTDPASIDRVRDAVANEEEITIDLLNYTKKGTPFWNELHISPIHDDEGRLIYFFASQLDVSKRRRAQELEATERRLLMEVDHRAKNALAIVQSIVRLSRADDPAAYARSVQGRVDVLARAHALLAAESWRDISLKRLVEAEIATRRAEQISCGGPPIRIAPGRVQPLSLIFHELLANACHHGALSSPQGAVAIDWIIPRQGRLGIAWREQGGPTPASAPSRGFGLKIVEGMVRNQLGGDHAFDWTPDGLRLDIALPTG